MAVLLNLSRYGTLTAGLVDFQRPAGKQKQAKEAFDSFRPVLYWRRFRAEEGERVYKGLPPGRLWQ
jgi:hypothetical protein